MSKFKIFHVLWMKNEKKFSKIYESIEFYSVKIKDYSSVENVSAVSTLFTKWKRIIMISAVTLFFLNFFI